jgi:broad specificity phosphatase PhoE
MIIQTAEQTRLILVRHGQTEWNRVRRVQGHTDTSLDKVGRAQAERVARRLEVEGIAAVYASDLKRAQETAQRIAAKRGLTVQTSPLFREAHYGLWEGMTVAEIEAQYPEAYRRWREDSLRNRAPEGETLEELQQRALAGAAEILHAHGGGPVVIVAHGGSIRSLICGLLEWPLASHRQLRLDNASISRIDFGPYGPTLTAFNDTCHLAGSPEEGEAASGDEEA